MKFNSFFKLVFLGLFSTTNFLYAAEAECERNIVYLPQFHFSTSAELLTDVDKKDVLDNQWRLYQFLSQQDKRIPIFTEGLAVPVQGEKQRISFQQTLGINAPIRAQKISQLSAKEKEALIKVGAPMVLFATGERDIIYGVSPSLEAHKEIHQQVDEIKAKEKNQALFQEKMIQINFIKRDQWALINALKWFKQNPRIPLSFLVYGASHNFADYQKFLPKDVCISETEQFPVNQMSRYQIQDPTLLTNYLESEHK